MAAAAPIAAAASSDAHPLWQVAYESPSTVLGEGPTWSVRDQCLYYVDIARGLLHRYTPPADAPAVARAKEQTGPLAAGGQVDTIEFGAQIGTVALTDQPQRILLAAENGVWLFDWSTLRAFPLAPFPQHPTPDASASKQEPTKGVWRFNDGKASPTGTFVVGTTHMDEEYGKGLARVFEYFVSKETGQLNSKRIHEGVSISNGLDWEQSGNSMIYIDTPSGKVERFVWDASCSGASRQRRQLQSNTSPMRNHGRTGTDTAQRSVGQQG